MRRVAVINYKGGTGKTSTVVTVAHGLALKGHKVLVIDTDPQGSAGYQLGVQSAKSLYDIVINGTPVSECILSARPNLDIICANEHLYPAELLMAKMPQKEKVFSKMLMALEGYDFVILDCAPSLNLLNQNALVFADELLIPVSMEYLSLVGVKQLLNNIKIINRIFNKQLAITKVIPTFFDKRNKKSKDILESLERVFPGFLSSPIRVSVAMSESTGHRKTIFEFDPLSKGAEDYTKLINEVLIHGEEKTI